MTGEIGSLRKLISVAAVDIMQWTAAWSIVFSYAEQHKPARPLLDALHELHERRVLQRITSATTQIEACVCEHVAVHAVPAAQEVLEFTDHACRTTQCGEATVTAVLSWWPTQSGPFSGDVKAAIEERMALLTRELEGQVIPVARNQTRKEA